MSNTSEALERAAAAVRARQAGDIVTRVAITGETDHPVSSGPGAGTQRVRWQPTVDVTPYGQAPVRFTGEAWEAYVTARLAHLLVDRVVIGDGDGYEFEGAWASLEREFAELEAAR